MSDRRRTLWLTLAVLLMVLLTGLAWADESLPDATTAGDVQPAATTDTLGLGTEGYGFTEESGRVVGGEILGSRSGYVHPFLSVGGFYTDNLFNTRSDRKSDWVAVITPGIWLALPASRQQLLEINTLNTAPGGLAVSRFRSDADRRFQGYALYRADIREHDRFTDENRVDQRAEGMFRMSLRGGLSLELADVYEINRDPYGTGDSNNRKLDKYTSNLASAILAYKLSPKLTLRADYGRYDLDYSSQRNSYRDRADDTVSGYVYYALTPKLSTFVQAEYIQVDYDDATRDDSDAMNYYLGLESKPTAKLRGRVRAGYGQKDYDRDSRYDRDDFLADGQIDYFITRKTSVYLRAARRILETDVRTARDIVSYRTQLGYRQRMTAKLRAEVSTYYNRNNYQGSIIVGGVRDQREDKDFGAIIALGFSPLRWFNTTIGYEYENRNSNFKSEDYHSNTVFLRLTAAM